MELEFSRDIFEKYPHIKFHENLSSVSGVVLCGSTALTNLTVAFRDFADAPKIFCLDDLIKIISPQADIP
jgi:hypothetical protein